MTRIDFFGWRVVAGAFVLAVFGWGIDFYGPPIYLEAVRAARGWSLAFVSSAVTLHFVFGALVVANLARLYRRFGLPAVTKAGAVALGLGMLGWAMAHEPWQLLLATAFTGAGWVTMGAAAINAIVAPWFVRERPRALSMAYNGASIGGIVFSPLWVAAIAAWSFPVAAAAVGLVTLVTVWWLADHIFAATPQGMNQSPDGGVPGTAEPSLTSPQAVPRPGRALWRDRCFRTLALAMALGLFAQIGMVAHLYSLLVPALGAAQAGLAMSLATAAAILGRMGLAWPIQRGADRRLAACLSYSVQIVGLAVLIAAEGGSATLLLLGVLLFGAGIGNATSLPPLIAQVEFVKADVARVIGLIVAIAQASYAFAPAGFGAIRVAVSDQAVFVVAILAQGAAIAMLLLGRRGA